MPPFALLSVPSKNKPFPVFRLPESRFRFPTVATEAMQPTYRIFYSFYEDDAHIDSESPLPVAAAELPAYLARLRLHGDFLGLVDEDEQTFQIMYEEFSGYYWGEVPDGAREGSHGRFYTEEELETLLADLPDRFCPKHFDGLVFERWYDDFRHSPYGIEAETLYQQSNEGGELVRIAEDLCESCQLGEWDGLCDEGLARLQRELPAMPAAYTPVNLQRLVRALNWLDDLVENNDLFDENCLDDWCDMVLARIVDYHNHRQPRH
ncbi:hypothetical protein [Neisseria shayeganii]|uniref:Uncharacterized protein n=1 Tax=Neisseria shayeganii TaxID=607712 RepID=A0A7D7S6D3_9NEIS|nr:hypothetical protein [Neisseria shayeganii]QMT41546.1 hypothetical protein H3L94_05885 [Neisseria shayeganii]